MSIEDFIFTRKTPQRFYRHIVLWCAYYLFSLATYFHDGLEKVGYGKWLLLMSIETFFQVIPQIIFCYCILYFLLPRYWSKKKYISFTVSIILLSVAIYWFYFLEHIVIFKRAHFYVGLPFRPLQLVYWFALIGMFTYYPVSSGLTIAIKTLKNFYLKTQENNLLSRENANAELQLLKAQIHPHFLFNTLNNIYSFTLNRSLQAPQLVLNLTDTLRYMINDCDAALAPLEKELKMIQDYIDLEKVRYDDRLHLEIIIKGNSSNKFITPLLLIPFVENCFKHGASKMLGTAWIRLHISIEENTLSMDLSNSKEDTEKTHKPNSGIGLTNIQKRLSILYPESHTLLITETTDSFMVNLQLPVQSLNEKSPSYTQQVAL